MDGRTAVQNARDQLQEVLATIEVMRHVAAFHAWERAHSEEAALIHELEASVRRLVDLLDGQLANTLNSASRIEAWTRLREAMQGKPEEYRAMVVMLQSSLEAFVRTDHPRSMSS